MKRYIVEMKQIVVTFAFVEAETKIQAIEKFWDNLEWNTNPLKRWPPKARLLKTKPPS